MSVLSLALAGAPAGAEDLDEEGANVGSPHKTAADVPAPAPSSSLSDSAVPEESPWLVTPSFSVDPKLGTTAGGIIAYMPRFDEQSTPSIIGVAASYSNTDSVAGGVFADTYWNGARHRLLAGVAFGGVGCLYGAEKPCTENLYPSVGVWLTYLIKPQAGVIVRAEAAKGDGDNSAFYLRFGHPF